MIEKNQLKNLEAHHHNLYSMCGMKKIYSFTILPLIAAGILASCNDSNNETSSNSNTEESNAGPYSDLTIDNIHEPAIEIINKYGTALSSIKDEASIDAANEKFDELKKETDALLAAAAKLEKPPIDKIHSVSSQYGGRVEGGLSEEFQNSRKYVRKIAGMNPELKPKISALTSRFYKEVGPIKNIFDAGGALSYPLDQMIEQAKKEEPKE